MDPDTSHGAVALMIGVNFLSAFNGMQQRASQLAIAVERLGFALHYVSLGTLQATSECAHADVAVVCHTPGTPWRNMTASLAGHVHTAPYQSWPYWVSPL